MLCYEEIKNILNNEGILIKEAWLSSFLENLSPESGDFIQALLKTDISETCHPTNLDEFVNQPHAIFENDKNEKKQIFLQINEVVDISLPKNQRLNYEISKNPTLKIFLTDGINNFFAISKKPITSFSTTVQPGSKLLIKTPIEIRYGIIFLSEANIDFLNENSPQICPHQ